MTTPHMTLRNVEKALKKAAELCSASGGRLTEKRSHILAILLADGMPRSAYEIADAHQQQFGQPMAAMSVYRILEYLASESLVHKLSTSNKYIACSHIACDHAHQVPQFLICSKCHRVKEIGIDRAIVDALKASCEGAGFTLVSPQLELNCVCAECSAAEPVTSAPRSMD